MKGLFSVHSVLTYSTKEAVVIGRIIMTKSVGVIKAQLRSRESIKMSISLIKFYPESTVIPHTPKKF